MPWIALAALLVVVSLVLVVAIRFGAIRKEAFREAWRSFATSRGLRWIEASGPWYRHKSDAIEGSVEDVAIRLDTYVVSTGKTQVTFTRVQCRLGRPFPGKIVAKRRTFLTGIGEKLGRRSLRTGDPTFDGKMVVRSKSGDIALRLFDEKVRSRARAIERPVSIQIAGEEAKAWWRGAETDPSVLDAACNLVAALARASASA